MVFSGSSDRNAAPSCGSTGIYLLYRAGRRPWSKACVQLLISTGSRCDRCVVSCTENPSLAWSAGIRDAVLFGEFKLLFGFVAILVSALDRKCDSWIFPSGYLPVSRSHIQMDSGMHLERMFPPPVLACPSFSAAAQMRQLILSGEGNTDSVVTVLGLMAGAAFAHNFGLASSADGPTANGKIAVVIGIIVVAVIGVVNSRRKEA